MLQLSSARGFHDPRTCVCVDQEVPVQQSAPQCLGANASTASHEIRLLQARISSPIHMLTEEEQGQILVERKIEDRKWTGWWLDILPGSPCQSQFPA